MFEPGQRKKNAMASGDVTSHKLTCFLVLWIDQLFFHRVALVFHETVSFFTTLKLEMMCE